MEQIFQLSSSPILNFVLMAGPLGYALYLGARALTGRRSNSTSTPASVHG